MEDPVQHVVEQIRRLINHPAQHIRRLSTRPPYRLGVAGVATVAAAGMVTMVVNQPPEPADRTAPAGVAAAALAPDASSPAAPTSAPAPGDASPSDPASSAASRSAAAPTTQAPPKPPATKSLAYDYQAQTTFYYCGPAATRIALSAMGRTPSQDDLARRLNTSELGTDSAADTTRVLNGLGKGADYVTRELPGAPSPAQMDRLQADAVRAIGGGRPIVANIVGSQVDTEGGWHDYPGGHYVTVVGYRDQGRLLKIADPAFVNGQSSYWITTIDLAKWMATRGYST
ncbi:C39 family peptidase [Plantactinospora sp. GCM10030261]|uniref:C39 family peptidase n=1 Tax=Plantactinospora sp. GCM10030261 TaxID=3273420 RepID=UPI00360C4DE6